MSGSGNYTQTPNLGLFKPVFNADVGNWGAHWNTNADTLDAAVFNAGVGTFLPLSGGTVTGNISFPSANTNVSVWGPNSHIEALCFYALIGNTLTFSGAQTPYQYGFLFNGNLAGNAAAGATPNLINIPTDSVTLPPGAEGLSWLAIKGNVGGTSTAMSGSRAALYSEMVYLGPCASANPADRQWQAQIATFQSATNAGGTAGTTLGIGYAGGDQAWLHSGATYWNGLIGREIDVGIDSGASASRRVGLQVVSWSGVQATANDYGICVSAFSGAPGFMYTFALGPQCVDPTSGIIFGYQPPAGATGTHEPLPKAFRGIDLSQYLFSDSAFRAAGGFVVDGAGAVNVGSAKLSVTAAGQARLDVPGQAITAIAINNGGTNYAVGDLLRGPYGSVVTVSTIGAGGTITAITVQVYGGTTLASPSTTAVHFDGGAGAGSATFNLTFTAAGGSLALQPSGGQTTFGGTVGPISFGQVLGASGADLTKHLTLFNDGTNRFGIGVSSGQLNFVSASYWAFETDAGGTAANISQSGAMYLAGSIGLFGTIPIASKPTVTGAKGSNAALASLLTALASYGLVTDSTTA